MKRLKTTWWGLMILTVLYLVSVGAWDGKLPTTIAGGTGTLLNIKTIKQHVQSI